MLTYAQGSRGARSGRARRPCGSGGLTRRTLCGRRGNANRSPPSACGADPAAPSLQEPPDGPAGPSQVGHTSLCFPVKLLDSERSAETCWPRKGVGRGICIVRNGRCLGRGVAQVLAAPAKAGPRAVSAVRDMGGTGIPAFQVYVRTSP